MKLTRFLFVIFLAFLFLFFWRTAMFWFIDRENYEVAHDVILYLGLFIVEFVSIILIIYKLRKRKIRGGIHLICLGWGISMCLVQAYNGVSVSILAKCLAWPILFEATYLFVAGDRRRIGIIRKLFYLVAGMGLLFFLTSMRVRQLGYQSNMIYFFALATPILLVTKNTRLRNAILLLTSFMCLLSFKRSMILAIMLFWGIVGVTYFVNPGKKWLTVALTIAVCVFGFASFSVVDKISGGYLSSRLENDEDKDITNGREGIYLATLDLIVRSSPAQFVFGHGHNAVRQNSARGKSAHNEWLEIIYDYGLISLFFYICLWVYLIKRWLFHHRKNTLFFVPFTLTLSFFLVMSMVSQLVLYVSYFLYLVMFWAMAEAATESEYMLYLRERRGNGLSRRKRKARLVLRRR